MNTGGHSYWLSNRRIHQGALAQTLPAFAKSADAEAVVPNLISSLLLVPSWILLGMILIATLGICSTVIMRTRAELAASALQYQRLSSEIDIIRRSNDSLETEIKRMTTDPTVIESSARARLGMVRPNDIVVPIGVLQSESIPIVGSFVR